ncbi:hypothetical protein U1Q18_019513 [Sarracenia purpurea var. burkii]
MQSSCVREASKACSFNACCLAPFLAFPELQNPSTNSFAGGGAAASATTPPRYDFHAATTSSLHPHGPHFTNHESIPSFSESFSTFIKAYPKYAQTNRADQIRSLEYRHLSSSNHVCLDYIGHGLFSYSQQQIPHSRTHLDSNSNSPNVHFFNIRYKSVNLNSELLYKSTSEEPEFESKLRKRIMGFMNISEDDYSMIFTANRSSSCKLLGESYPFHCNKNLLTVYDYESEAVEAMIESSSKRGARVRSAEFSWPTLRIQSKKLRKMVVGSKKNKKKKKGLFVFPLQSSVTGARYPYQWMSTAQENGWHVLLDATALGAKGMETLGLSLFQPDFLICSFFKIFGENPSGFGCLFVKKSSSSVFNNSRINTSTGIINLIPQPSNFPSPKQDSAGPSSIIVHRSEETETPKTQEIEEEEVSFSETSETGFTWSSELECRGLDHADSLGLILIGTRTRYQVNWVVNALMRLQHPHSENGMPLVKIYGPKIGIDRGPAVAFNLFDWKGSKIEPKIVQKLADRNKISLSCGFLNHIWFSEKFEEERERLLEMRISDEKRGGGGEGEGEGEEGRRVGNRRRGKRSRCGIYVIMASPGFLTNFEDMYKLWAFVSRFLDADFVEKERWRYKALNQRVIEV